MNQLQILILLGSALLLLFVFGFVARGLRGSASSPPDSARLSKVLLLPALEFPHARLLLSPADYHFLRSAPALSAVARTLRRDRGRLLNLWLAQLQGDVLKLWRFRRFLSRHGVTAGAGEEVSIALSAVSLLLILSLFRVTVTLAGPFAITGVLSAVPRLADTTRAACARAFAQLPASRAAEIRSAWLSA